MKKLAFILALGFISNSFSQKELFISSSIIKKFNEPRSQLNIVLANGVNTFTHQIDIHVTQVLINKVTLEVNSYYSIDLDNNTLNFKCLSDGRDISSDIISKSENNGVITIVIDDESELDSNVKLTPIFTIDKNNNSVIFSSLEDGTNFIYKFLEFTINIQ